MIRVSKSSKSLHTTVQLTSSKSITNRVLIIRALSKENFEISNQSNSDDSKILADCLSNTHSEINAGDAGTAFRFLTAYLSVRNGTFILKGSERMNNRPIGKLVEALRSLGAKIEFLQNENYPPLKITGQKLKGGRVKIDASESSQFVSALLLIAPEFSDGLEIELTGKKRSWPYVQMTISVMKYFGVDVGFENNILRVSPSKYISKPIQIENDWSAASLWYQAVALSSSAKVIIESLTTNSIQGDALICDIMKNFNVDTTMIDNNIKVEKNSSMKLPDYFSYDFSNCPDLVIPVAFTCAALQIKSEFNGVGNLRLKESDRMQAIKSELEKIGSKVILSDDSFLIEPLNVKGVLPVFNSYKDHRMVMAESFLSLIKDEIVIEDHLPVNKSYPEFWNQLKSSGFDLTIT